VVRYGEVACSKYARNAPAQAHHLILLVLFTAMGYLLSIKIFGNDYPTLQHGSPMIGAGLNLQRLFSIDTGTPDILLNTVPTKADQVLMWARAMQRNRSALDCGPADIINQKLNGAFCGFHAK
jgi:hypothetical protein